jgi:ribosomal protein S2
MDNFLQIKKIKIFNTNSLLSELLRNKIYLGSNNIVRHPNAVGYLKGVRNKTYVFDVFQLVRDLQKALRVMYKVHSVKFSLSKRGRMKVEPTKKILFVGFPENNENVLQNLCLNQKHFYVLNQEWVNGLLTNNESLSEYKRTFLKNLKAKTETEKRLFYQNFKGILKLHSLPDLVVIYNHSQNSHAFIEAKRMNIPVISFLNASDNPSVVDYPILGNFTSVIAGNFFCELIKGVLKTTTKRF